VHEYLRVRVSFVSSNIYYLINREELAEITWTTLGLHFKASTSAVRLM